MNTITSNIFATAKKVEKPSVKSKTHKTIIATHLENKVQRFNQLKQDIDNLEAEKKMLEGELKSFGREQFFLMFQATKLRPESFIIQDNIGANVMFLATDKYTIVTTEKAEFIESITPELLNKTKIFSFDEEILQRNLEAISNAILGADMIDEDKNNLIIATEKIEIKKGAIDTLGQYKEVANVFELVNPICMLKPQK
jgi:hypothetical protein